MALTFEPARVRYDPNRDMVRFIALDGLAMVRCAVSREVLMDEVRSTHAADADLVDIYIIHADEIQQIVERKYVANEIEPDGFILVETADLKCR